MSHSTTVCSDQNIVERINTHMITVKVSVAPKEIVDKSKPGISVQVELDL